MRTIIAGSRSITDYAVVREAITKSGFVITEVVSGHASKRLTEGGWVDTVDLLGERYSREELGKEPRVFYANWLQFGKAAGPRRNDVMAQYAEALIAVWDGKSPGTAHMIRTAKGHDLKVFVYRTEERVG